MISFDYRYFEMKTIHLFLVLFFALAITNVKASSTVKEHETNPTNNDTSTEVKTNNVSILKLIPTPITNNSNNNSSGSLKKAGKVARISYSHSTSIENIIYKKKGI